MARYRKVATITRHLASIAQAHKQQQHESPARAAVVQNVLKGIRRAKGTAPAQKDAAEIAVIRNGGPFDNNRIRLVGLDGATSTVSGATEAGFVDGAMATARFSRPQAMSVAANGDIYVTDLGNFRVRCIVGDRVETIAGIHRVFELHGVECDVLAAMPRNAAQFTGCALAGADAIAVSTEALRALLLHPLTDRGIDQFLTDLSRTHRTRVK